MWVDNLARKHGELVAEVDAGNHPLAADTSIPSRDLRKCLDLY